MKFNLEGDEGFLDRVIDLEAMANFNLEAMGNEIPMNNLGAEMPRETSSPPLSHHLLFANPYNIEPFSSQQPSYYDSQYHQNPSSAPLSAPISSTLASYCYDHGHHQNPSSTPSCYGHHQNLSSSTPPSVAPSPSLMDRFRALSLQSDPSPSPYLYPCPLPRQLVTRRVPEIPNLTQAPIRSPARPALYNYEDIFIHEALEGRRRRGPMYNMPGYNNNWLYIYHIAKDQNGCRSLQKKIDEGRRHEIDVIFNGVIAHAADLMMDPFANYLLQKLLDVCTEEQRLRIVLNLTRDPWELIRVSLNTHGTRVVQKLIETLKTPQQIRLIVLALKPGFLHLIRDLNGNHVIQCCLKSFLTDDNKFIFDAAAQYCVQIATHRHGCCVLQRCITFSTGEYRARLVEEIAAHGLMFAQDSYGNYVVQFIIELKNPSIMANLASQFEGNYVHLSTQKFSSNVVEKCLKHFVDINRQAMIVLELLQFGRFEMLLQDPFANYVIQTALDHTQGRMHAALVDAILPHEALRSPYCKRVFVKARMKK